MSAPVRVRFFTGFVLCAAICMWRQSAGRADPQATASQPSATTAKQVFRELTSTPAPSSGQSVSTLRSAVGPLQQRSSVPDVPASLEELADLVPIIVQARVMSVFTSPTPQALITVSRPIKGGAVNNGVFLVSLPGDDPNERAIVRDGSGIFFLRPVPRDPDPIRQMTAHDALGFIGIAWLDNGKIHLSRRQAVSLRDKYDGKDAAVFIADLLRHVSGQ